jgi:hypothetical protein
MSKAPKDTATSQRQRFIEAARQAGADEESELFEQQLKAVARPNSVPGAKADKPKKSGRKTPGV